MNRASRHILAWILTGSAASLGGCGLFSSPIPEGGRPVREIYDDMDGRPGATPLEVSPVPEPGAPVRTRPVIFPPKVFAVFVLEHLDPARDLKVGSHWVYFKLRDSSWTEQAIDREPERSVPLEKGEDLAPLKRVLAGNAFSEALIPYQGTAEPPKGREKDDPPKRARPEYDFMNGAKAVQR